MVRFFLFILGVCLSFSPLQAAPNASSFTLLSAKQTHRVFMQAREKVRQLLQAKVHPPLTSLSGDQAVARLIQPFMGAPYLYQGATGEGDWTPGYWQYHPGAAHIQQDPVYRVDGFDCQTFVSLILALLQASTLAQFERTLLKINYGAAPGYAANQLHYFNRNHFISSDFNPINEKNGYLKDAITTPLKTYITAKASATICRIAWFQAKKKTIGLHETVRVLSPDIGVKMVRRFLTYYPPSVVRDVRVTMTYIPKAALLRETGNGYVANSRVFDAIPTPAIVEFVRDSRQWWLGQDTMADRLQTEILVSHIGLLYRQNFPRGKLIYQKISCEINRSGKKTCGVVPVYCHEKVCHRLMFASATQFYPKKAYWYAVGKHVVCRDKKPTRGTAYTTCNRVEALPLEDYLGHREYGQYAYMADPSQLGIHIETLVFPAQ